MEHFAALQLCTMRIWKFKGKHYLTAWHLFCYITTNKDYSIATTAANLRKWSTLKTRKKRTKNDESFLTMRCWLNLPFHGINDIIRQVSWCRVRFWESKGSVVTTKKFLCAKIYVHRHEEITLGYNFLCSCPLEYKCPSDGNHDENLYETDSRGTFIPKHCEPVHKGMQRKR